MAQVLFITAHPNDHHSSYSMAVGKEFLDAYRKANPNDEVIEYDLYKQDIPHIDADVFSGWGKLRSGSEFAQLTTQEQAKVGRLSQLADEFVAADKYVFVTPMWNFSYPPIMKAYIDSICVAGKTFRYTENGPIGLLGDKKALHIQASGSVYTEGPMMDLEMAHRHLKIIMNFIGIQSLEALFVEGMAAAPDQAESIKEKAIQRAHELAKTF